MKIIPVILCGGGGTRLWEEVNHNQIKQFIDFGGWTLFEKTLQRIKSNIYDYPIIITNKQYVKTVKKFLNKNKFNKFYIISEPIKKNTNAAIASIVPTIGRFNSSSIVPIVVFPSDHFIENFSKLNNSIKNHLKYLNSEDIFIFGIKPYFPSNQYGYFTTKKITKTINKVSKFIEKPNKDKAKLLIKKNGYWNSGIVLTSNLALLKSYNKHDPKTLSFAYQAVDKGKKTHSVLFLSKNKFQKIKEQSFDYSILEKYKYINGIKLKIKWSDLGNWFEILKIFNKFKFKYFKKKNIFYRPWGFYTNLYRGKGFLIKELFIKPNGILSLQKHYHRSERWIVTKGTAKITLGKKIIYKKNNETIEIPKGTIHRIENNTKKSLKIMEAQIGKILKESDIVRYKDIYGRVK